MTVENAGMIRCSRCKQWAEPESICMCSARPVCLECWKIGVANRQRRTAYEPTAEEIAVRCESIQRTWSDAQREHRAGLAGRRPWTAHEILRTQRRKLKAPNNP